MRVTLPQRSRSSGIFRLILLGVALTLCKIRAQSIDTTFLPGGINQLTLQTNSETQDIYRAFESTLPTIGDQIDLRYPANFSISNITVPSGWAFQNISVDDTEKVATYFYQGTNPANTAEFYNFATALALNFQIKQLSGNSVESVEITLDATLTVFLDQLQIFAAARIPATLNAKVASDALVTFRENSGLPADGTQDTMDASGNGIHNILYYALGLGDPSQQEVDQTRLSKTIESDGAANFSFVRHKDQVNDGLTYTIESTTDFGTWTPIANLPAEEQAISESPTSLDAVYERIEFTFNTIGTRRFYRLAVAAE